jgi:SRSO17 transposase
VAGELRRELFAQLAGVFAQARSRFTAFAYIGALLWEPGDRRSCWQLAEAAGHAAPRRMQALLAGHRWDWAAALAALQRFIVGRLGDAGAILAIDETAELKKGDHTVGVARQCAGITGQAGELPDGGVRRIRHRARPPAVRLYLPRSWFRDVARRARARPGQDEVRGQAGAGRRDGHRRGPRAGAVLLGGRR